MNIGLTQRIIYNKNRAYDSVEHEWYSYLKEHTLSFIRNDLNQDFVALANSLDGLIITGGDDSALRRSVELKLASEMMKQLKPVLGVCHGALLMTDVLGGEFTCDESHMNAEHTVTYMGEEHTVQSHHSNIISKIHDTATVLATDENGNCEAWIDGDIAGIMWHPQRMKEPFLPIEIANKFQI